MINRKAGGDGIVGRTEDQGRAHLQSAHRGGRINSSSGLPSAAGKNSARLKNEVWMALAFSVNKNNKDNP